MKSCAASRTIAPRKWPRLRLSRKVSFIAAISESIDSYADVVKADSQGAVGRNVGRSVGNTVGFSVGASVGIAVELDADCSVGATVGIVVGSDDGGVESLVTSDRAALGIPESGGGRLGRVEIETDKGSLSTPLGAPESEGRRPVRADGVTDIVVNGEPEGSHVGVNVGVAITDGIALEPLLSKGRTGFSKGCMLRSVE